MTRRPDALISTEVSLLLTDRMLERTSERIQEALRYVRRWRTVGGSLTVEPPFPVANRHPGLTLRSTEQLEAELEHVMAQDRASGPFIDMEGTSWRPRIVVVWEVDEGVVGPRGLK
jgi:hypothetical protein